jgi:DNA helicase-2/ATP-dependent DNA helicase PcrA
MTLDLHDLNPAQYDAATTTEGPLLVLAGAGSGKTRVLTYRIAHMIGDLNVSPYEILAITFTNKAAAEMRERLSRLLPGGMRGMWVLTFHAMCVRMLRNDAELAGYPRNFTIYDDSDSKRLFKEIYEELDISPKRAPVNSVRQRISAAKNELIGAAEYAQTHSGFLEDVTAKVYTRYEQRLLKADAMDFDDLLINAYRLLAKNPTVLAAYQDRFRYILVDEYQDTNHAQYLITRLLAEKNKNIMVVGDDDQSIYSWRGADIRNILEFEQDYPQAKVVKLEENYRSTATILNAANGVIANNASRKSKRLFTNGAAGEKVAIYQAADERDEGRWIAAEVEKLHRTGRPYSDFALFYRTNAQSRILEDMLMRAGVPYRIVGGTRFYDRAEIRDVMAYLKAVTNPADDLALKRIINTPKRGIGKTTVERIEQFALEDDLTFAEAMQLAQAEDFLKPAARKALAQLDSMLAEARRMEGDLRNIVERIVDQSGLIPALQEEGSDEALARIENIQEFFGVVQEYDESHQYDELADGDYQDSRPSQLANFMEWLALRTDLDSLVEGDSYVTLMTVHSAKGLEFPVVFIAGLEDSLFPHFNAAEAERGIEEERRLAYVAITRARELLYLTHARVRNLYGSTQANPRSCFIGEIPGECLRSAGAGSDGFKGTGWEKRGDRHGTFGSGTSFEREGRAFGDGDGSKKPALVRTVFTAGDEVDHKTFGRGVVLKVEGDALLIKFKKSGQTKKLLAEFAPLVKLN